MTLEGNNYIKDISAEDIPKSTFSDSEIKQINNYTESTYKSLIKESENGGKEITKEVLNQKINNELDKITNENTKEFIKEYNFTFNDLYNEVVNNNIPKELKPIIDKISQEKDLELKDIKISKLIKEGKYAEAISEGLNLLRKAIFGEIGDTGLDNFKDLDSYIKTLNLKEMNQVDLQKNIDFFTKKIENIPDAKKKMRFTYVMSAIKNKLVQNRSSKNMSGIELFNHNVEVGDVLLINKVNKSNNFMTKVGDGLLSEYNKLKGDVNYFLHSVIISKIEKGEIYITHSTLKRSSHKDGLSGIEEIPLSKLLSGYQSADILSMKMPKEKRNNTLKHVNQKLQQQKQNNNNSLYDKGAVLSEVFNSNKIKVDKEEKVNCVELIAEGIGEKDISNINNPTDFMKSNVLTPSYITTI